MVWSARAQMIAGVVGGILVGTFSSAGGWLACAMLWDTYPFLAGMLGYWQLVFLVRLMRTVFAWFRVQTVGQVAQVWAKALWSTFVLQNLMWSDGYSQNSPEPYLGLVITGLATVFATKTLERLSREPEEYGCYPGRDYFQD